MTEAILPGALRVTQDRGEQDICICSLLVKRIQAVWCGFCLLMGESFTRLFNWCASWIVTPTPTSDPEPATQEELVNWYKNAWIQDSSGCHVQISSGDVPKNFIEKHQHLFSAACPLYTNEADNYTERLLHLGADPNQKVSHSKNYKDCTPLRSAVLTGCYLAYVTLRNAGADPNVKCDQETTAELIHKMAASPLDVPDYYVQEVAKRSEIRRTLPGTRDYFGQSSGEEWRTMFGTKMDIAKMSDYELQRIITQIGPILSDTLPPPLIRLVAEHLASEPFV